jgi:YD repeat-containing protein
LVARFVVRFHLRVALALLLSSALLSQGSAAVPVRAAATMALANPPVRVQVPEPPRVKPSLPPASSMHAAVAPFAPRGAGVRVPGWPMLRPNQIDGVLKAAARRRQAASTARATATPVARRAPEAVGSQSSVRRTQSLPSDPAASGTGINHWWRYQEQSVPGGGRVMVNVGTGNLLLQDDDMSVAHKGLAMAFRRTYNSQSGHDVNASDAAGFVYEPPGMYGNGWTSTFDARMARNAAMTVYSVFDIDGARYDYDATWSADQTSGTFTPRAGNHTTLAYDGVCGFLWTKKSGTTYYFYAPGPHAPCPQTGGSTEGFTGRLYQIVGRNRNTYITFSYVWDNGVSSLSGKISQITATTESGMSATLSFADVNGHRLLQQLTYPDGTTSVQYAYDNAGNLLTVSHPANNDAGTRPVQWYGYQTLGTGSVLYYAASPRYHAACQIACGSDGLALFFGYTGTSAVTATVNFIGHFGVVNPSIADGSGNSVLQPGYAQSAFVYLEEFYTTGVGTPTYRDTDGHMTNWVVDGSGRPAQTQECTASTNQGQQCTGTWLVTNEGWDADNNLIAETDARGNETDYAYDLHGNTVAAAAPPPAPGAFRPTRLFTYDSQDNLIAYCDPNATHSLQADWSASPTAPIPGQGGLCPQTTIATRYQWTPTASEPFGELTAAISPATTAAPGGYQHTFFYDASQQGGADYGLPTRVTGTSVTQNDPATPTRTPQQSFWYDQSGNLICYGTGSGQWLLTYDALGRLKTAADPDDSLGGTGACGKTGAQPNWNTTAYTSFFADGSVSQKQSAAQHANGIGATFTYDLDGNVTTETHHYGCMSVTSCTAGVTKKWYDGAGRLIEVQQPYDASDVQQYPWSTRYIYDLSHGGVTPYRGMGLAGYGNLVTTQELLSGTVWAPVPGQPYSVSGATWTDVRATSFDALDRAVLSYEAAFGDQPKLSNTYDGPGALGLLTSVRLATGEMKSLVYDALARQTDVSYAYDGGVTPGIHLGYDANGQVTSRSTSVLGTETITYDAAGAITSVTEPASLGGGTITYGYYADGLRARAGYSDSIQSFPSALQYAYRSDGKRDRLVLPNGSLFTWSYTAAGRLQTQADPLTGTTVHPDATYQSNKVERAYYPSSVTYGPWTQTYDIYGRPDKTTLPVSLFGYDTSQYDLDDGISGLSAFGATLSQSDPRYASYGPLPLQQSTVRNEKNAGTVPPGAPTSWVAIAPAYQVNGTWLSLRGPRRSSGSVQNWTLDARAGMLLTNVGTAAGVTEGSSYLYDSSGRLTQDFEGASEVVGSGSTTNGTYTAKWCPVLTGTSSSIRCYTNGSRSKTYDAENRLRSETFEYSSGATATTYGAAKIGGYWEDSSGYGQPPNLQAVDYGATSHPMRIALYHPDYVNNPNFAVSETRGWLWDGNDRFIECQLVNAQCQSASLSLEGLGDYDLAHGTMIRVNDRGRTGGVVMFRNATDFSGFTDGHSMTARAPQYAPCSSAPAGDVPYNSASTCAPLHDGKITADGWTLDYETWQGVRTSDQSTGRWNTPDAYAGEVHDPMSQKPFMWNMNNAYKYSDPSGYAAWDRRYEAEWNASHDINNDIVALGGDMAKLLMTVRNAIGEAFKALAEKAKTVSEATFDVADLTAEIRKNLEKDGWRPHEYSAPNGTVLQFTSTDIQTTIGISVGRAVLHFTPVGRGELDMYRESFFFDVAGGHSGLVWSHRPGRMKTPFFTPEGFDKAGA